MKFFTYCLLFVLIITSSLLAYSPATTGFQFLRTQVGARPAALAGAFVAINGDVNNIHYNPAGIGVIEQRTASFTYLNDLLDINSGFIGFVQPLVGKGNLGLGILYKNYGSFDKLDENGQELGTFGAASLSFNASYAIKLKENLYVGGTGKYIRASIENYSADALAVDGSISYFIPSQQLTFAAGFYNLGQAISAFVNTKDDLPFNIRAGASKKLAHLPLLFNINTYKYTDDNWQAAIGGEFTLSPKLQFRLGYDSIGKKMETGSSKDTFAGSSLGLGLFLTNIRIDYSWTSFGVLGSLNRFTISGNF